MMVGNRELQGCFWPSGTQTRPEHTHACAYNLKGHTPVSAFSTILQKQHLRSIIPDSQQVKKARAALGGLSLAHPCQLVPLAPPNAVLKLGQQLEKGCNNKWGWVQVQYVRRQRRGGKPGEGGALLQTLRRCSLRQMWRGSRPSAEWQRLQEVPSESRSSRVDKGG